MTYIEQLVSRNFKRGESLKVKISFYELDEYKKPEKIKLYA